MMSIPISIYAIPLLFIIFFIIKFVSNFKKPNKTLPSSPPKLPIIGNLHQLGLHPHRSLRSLSQRHGSLMLLHLGSTPVLIVSSANAAVEIMKNHDLIFSNRPRSSIAEKLLYDCTTVSAAPYGEYWRQMKSICVLQMLSNKRIQSFRYIREEEVGVLMKKIEESLFSPVNLSEKFAILSNDVVCRVAFGRKYGGGEHGGRKFKEVLGEFLAILGGFHVGEFIPWLGWVHHVNGLNGKVNKVSEEIDKFLTGVIEEHMDKGRRNGNGYGDVEGKKGQDFVDILFEIQKENTVGLPVTNENIKALILDMFAAGTDTTSTVMEWLMIELLRHPRIMKKLQEEVRQVANSKPQITQQNLDKMHYLKAVIKETLRLHPPVPLLVPRLCSQDIKIQGYDIEARTTVIINAWAIGKDPKSWDEPEEFRPERFLNSCIDFKGHHFELIPFGAGRRICARLLFAMATNELVLANVVHKFNWELPNGIRGEDLDMTECSGVTIHRKFPLIAIPTTCS